MSKLGDLLRVAASQIGTRENPPGSNLQKYGAWYGMNAVAWCAEFVSWCADQAGLLGTVIPKYAYTPAGADWFKSRNRWGAEPRVGAIAFFDIAGMGRISHTGVVEKVLSDGWFLCIEGNTNGSGSRTGGEVWRQKRRNMGPRGGFGYPDYPQDAPAAAPAKAAPAPAPAPAPTVETYAYGGRLIRYRDRDGKVIRPPMSGGDVARLQRGLNRHAGNLGRAKLAEDGEWGPKSDEFLYAYQQARHDAPFRLDADRIAGPATFDSLGR